MRFTAPVFLHGGCFCLFTKKPGEARRGRRERHGSKDCAAKRIYFLLCPFSHDEAMAACPKMALTNYGRGCKLSHCRFLLKSFRFPGARNVHHPPYIPPGAMGRVKELSLPKRACQAGERGCKLPAVCPRQFQRWKWDFSPRISSRPTHTRCRIRLKIQEGLVPPELSKVFRQSDGEAMAACPKRF